MKKLKKFIVLFTAALFCMLPLLSQPLTAQASTPTTYYVKMNESTGEWRFQVGNSWDSQSADRAFYYMTLDIKDGDILVVEGSGSINLNVHLSNLTVLKGDMVLITAKSFDEVYIASGVTAVINGDAKYGYVYDDALANFNNNVQKLDVNKSSTTAVAGSISELYVYDPTDPKANVECVGTVGYVKAYDDDYVYYEYYNFAAGSLKIDHGNVKADASKYSTTAPAATTTPAAPSNPADELDDVPKTGNFSVSPLWFLAIAAVCMLGYFKLERR